VLVLLRGLGAVAGIVRIVATLPRTPVSAPVRQGVAGLQVEAARVRSAELLGLAFAARTLARRRGGRRDGTGSSEERGKDGQQQATIEWHDDSSGAAGMAAAHSGRAARARL
jgi:hypothetical protein